ncbi:MAG: DoxX family protein [Bacteroidales bacterium]
MFRKIIRTDDSKTTLIIRLMVGTVFFSEGIQKFLYPLTNGAGRFETIGLPWPEFFGPFVGVFEIICGALILIGLITRLAAVPTLIIMMVAILTTKIPMLNNSGFWEMAHAARTDWAMLLGSLFLLIKGGGGLSFDRYLR